MKEKINIKSKKTLHEIQLIKKESRDFFEQFTNWLSGEFDLFLQEKSNNKLIIYYPNGFININYDSSLAIVKVIIKNKIKRNCIELNSIVIATYKKLKI